jgi:hypothetical protein
MRKCALCEQGLRDGDSPLPVRVTDEDLKKVAPGHKTAIKATLPGLYSSCPECVAVMRPIIEKRLGVPADQFTDNHLV